MLHFLTTLKSCYSHRNREKTEKIVTALNLKILPRDMKSKDTRTLLTAIFSQWLPLSTAVLVCVVEQLPPPDEAQRIRLPKILYPHAEPSSEPQTALERALFDCDAGNDAPVVAYVSKMFAVPEHMLPENKRKQLTAEELRERGRLQRAALKAGQDAAGESASESGSTAEDDVPLSPAPAAKSAEVPSTTESQPPVATADNSREILIGFARLYSGTVKVGQKLWVLGPKYDPAHPDRHCSEITVENLYLLMGRDLTTLQEVPAGNVFGIGGLEGHVLKNGTLASTKECKNLASVILESAPIVRVALEPTDPCEQLLWLYCRY